MPPTVRPTARVLLVDDTDRLLLFRGTSVEGEGFWFPVGGGVEEGETSEDAARREVWEETGLADVALGPEVWRRRHVITWHGVELDLRERWFLARVPSFEIDTSGFSADERADVVEHRWWTLTELAATTERLVPADLAARLGDLLIAGPPSEPIEVGT